MNATSVPGQEPAIDLSVDQLREVREILASVLGRQSLANANGALRAWVFGSRATGNARPTSDLDILISWPLALDWSMRADLRDAFEASHLPFKVDIAEEGGLSPDFAARVLGERLPLF